MSACDIGQVAGSCGLAAAAGLGPPLPHSVPLRPCPSPALHPPLHPLQADSKPMGIPGLGVKDIGPYYAY